MCPGSGRLVNKAQIQVSLKWWGTSLLPTGPDAVRMQAWSHCGPPRERAGQTEANGEES